MNQSNNQERQNVRMITPEQVSSQTQKEFMSQEELQRTQVLNLKDVQETVKYEKLHSKKPAIIVAIIGIVCLSIGSSFAFIQSMSARKAAKDAKIESESRKFIKENFIYGEVNFRSISYILLYLNYQIYQNNHFLHLYF